MTNYNFAIPTFSCSDGFTFCGGPGVISMFSSRGPFLLDITVSYDQDEPTYIQQEISVEFLITMASVPSISTGKWMKYF